MIIPEGELRVCKLISKTEPCEMGRLWELLMIFDNLKLYYNISYNRNSTNCQYSHIQQQQEQQHHFQYASYYNTQRYQNAQRIPRRETPQAPSSTTTANGLSTITEVEENGNGRVLYEKSENKCVYGIIPLQVFEQDAFIQFVF